MPENDRKTIIDRANRILKQSRLLRKMSDELKQESHDIRGSAKNLHQDGQPRPRRARKKR